MLLIIQSQICFSQPFEQTDDDYNNSGAIKITFALSTEEAQKLAYSDIDKGMPFLLLQSGISPIIYTTDSLFEHEHNVYYYENGCTGPEFEIIAGYNQVVFEHLDINYGKKWRKSVRKDVIGFKEWKKEN